MNQYENLARKAYQSPLVAVTQLPTEDAIRTSVNVKWDWDVDDNFFYDTNA